MYITTKQQNWWVPWHMYVINISYKCIDTGTLWYRQGTSLQNWRWIKWPHDGLSHCAHLTDNATWLMYSIWSSLDSVISFSSIQYVMNSLKHEVLLFKKEENYNHHFYYITYLCWTTRTSSAHCLNLTISVPYIRK